MPLERELTNISPCSSLVCCPSSLVCCPRPVYSNWLQLCEVTSRVSFPSSATWVSSEWVVPGSGGLQRKNSCLQWYPIHMGSCTWEVQLGRRPAIVCSQHLVLRSATLLQQPFLWVLLCHSQFFEAKNHCISHQQTLQEFDCICCSLAN